MRALFYKLLGMAQLDSSEINPSPEVAASRHARGGFYIMAIASLLVLLVCMFSCFKLNKLENWTKTDALLKSAVLQQTSQGAELQLVYQYKLGGKTVSATEVQRSSDIATLQKAKTRYENGPFSVYCNPSTPVESRVEHVDFTKIIGTYTLLGIACLLAFSGSVWVLCSPVKPFVPSINIKENRRIGTEKPFENTTSINESLHKNPRTKNSKRGEVGAITQSIVDAVSSESSPRDNTTGNTTDDDGEVLDLKKREKESL